MTCKAVRRALCGVALMLGTVANEDIAKATKLPIEKIEELSKQLKKETA